MSAPPSPPDTPDAARFPRLRRLLAHPRAPWVIVALALALHLPSVATGFTLDDHFQRVRLQAALDDTTTPLDAYPPTLWDIFVFVPDDPALRHELIDHGVLGFAADPALCFSFFRPLSALTHLLDNALWPTSPALAHLQSLAWLALLLFAAHRLYRRLHPVAWVAGLALWAFALDDTRAATAAWIANRNALIAAFFAVLALIAHDRWRRAAWRPGAGIGPLALLVALAAGESAIGVVGYLAAHALFLDRAPARQRVLALAPYALVVFAWAALYASLGYGVHHSGAYVDPADDPLRFIAAAATNVPILVTAQLSGIWSDFVLLLPSEASTAILIGCLAYLALLSDAVRTTLARSAEARFWALGAVLAAIPAASAAPSDRLLTLVGLGGAGLVACFLQAHALAPPAPTLSPRHRMTLRFWTVALIGVHLVFAPLVVPLRALGNGALGAYIERGERSLPIAPHDTQIIAVNPPSEAMLAYAPMMRASRGEPPPGPLRALAMGRSAVTLTRESPDTLRVRPAEPYLDYPMERLARLAPFAVGDRVELTGVTVEVTAITPDGRPRETLWRFARALEDPAHRFVAWSDEAIAFLPFSPPALGDSLTLPAVDLARAFRGY